MKYPIKTERLIIRLAEPEDAESIFSYRSDFAENKYQGWFPDSVEEVRDYISNMPATMDIAKKTKEGNPVTVRVPLNDKAKEILERYKEYEGKLLPFISEQKYNDAIKKIFKLAGVDRIVTILDPLTHNEIKRPIYEVASSHLARRTFIGNIYKKVKDPNLVSALSGHKEGSKAFRRYRDIDEEMKKDLVKLLD